MTPSREQSGGSAEDAPTVADLVVVGAGIVGLAVAREVLVRRPGSRVVVLEREDTVGSHQTGHNSGVIHSGVYYTPGSLKARLCVEGARLMYEYCDERGIAYERCGKLIVAVRPDELERLDEIERRGRLNGVQGLRRLDAADIGEVEPEARGIAALHCPSTGIVDYRQVTEELRKDVIERGGVVRTGVEARRLERRGDRTVVEYDGGSCTATMAITCAGLWSDRLAVASGASPDPRIVPFRGGYLHVRTKGGQLLRGLVYPVPDPDLPFLGVHVTKHIDGETVIGPTALLVGSRTAYRIWKLRIRDMLDIATWPGVWRMARVYWRTGITEMMMAARRRRFVRAAAVYVPRVAELGVDGPDIGGVRAQAVARDGTLVDDFVISETPGAMHVRNAPSPAATSSLALARELVDRLEAATAP